MGDWGQSLRGQSPISQVEESLGGENLEENLYTVLSQNSHQQNIRLILNMPELKQSGNLLKEFVAGIEEERNVQLVIVVDPKQMSDSKVRDFLTEDKKLLPEFVHSKQLRIIHEPMKKDRTFSLRNLLRKKENKWLTEGDYSNWLLNQTQRWSDLVGEILNDFSIKNGIELLERDLKNSFLTKTAA